MALPTESGSTESGTLRTFALMEMKKIHIWKDLNQQAFARNVDGF
jgi:hypothetical protein